MPTIIKVIPLVIVNVKVVGIIPVFCPVFGPRVNEHERKATVLKAGISHEYRGSAPDAERVCNSKIEAETVLRDVVTSIAAALPPSAMLVLPLSGAILLPGTMSLPATLLHPTSLLLPGACLFLSTLLRLLPARVLRLFWLLLRLLPARVLRLFWLLLRLLPARILLLFWLLLRLLPVRILVLFWLRPRLLPVRILLLFWLLLRLLPTRILLLFWLRLLLLGRLGALLRLLSLLLFRLTLFFVLWVMLCVNRSNGSENQNQRRHPDDGNALHRK